MSIMEEKKEEERKNISGCLYLLCMLKRKLKQELWRCGLKHRIEKKTWWATSSSFFLFAFFFFIQTFFLVMVTPKNDE